MIRASPHDRAPVHPRRPRLPLPRLPRAALSLHLEGRAEPRDLGMSTMLWKLLREDNPEYFAVAWDPPGPTFREEKFAAYKETRAPTPDDLRTQIPLVKTLFEALRLPLLEVPGFEADDVLGTRGRPHPRLPTRRGPGHRGQGHAPAREPAGARVLDHRARAGERVVFDEAAVKAKWGVEPEQIPDILALMGDSIDNIPGVPGVGEKTAAKLIGQFGGVDASVREPLPGAGEAARDAGRQSQAGAALARAGDRQHAGADRGGPREPAAAASPTGSGCARSGPSSSSHSLLRQLPAAARGRDGRRRRRADAGRRRRARGVPGEGARGRAARRRSRWATGGPPDPALTAIGLFHPAAGRRDPRARAPRKARACPTSAGAR